MTKKERFAMIIGIISLSVMIVSCIYAIFALRPDYFEAIKSLTGKIAQFIH